MSQKDCIKIKKSLPAEDQRKFDVYANDLSISGVPEDQVYTQAAELLMEELLDERNNLANEIRENGGYLEDVGIEQLLTPVKEPKKVPGTQSEVSVEETADKVIDKVRAISEEYHFEDAKRAYGHSTLHPDVPAKGHQEGFISTVNELHDELSSQITNDDQKVLLDDLIIQFKEDYLKHDQSVLNARSGVVSAHIAGKSNFNSKQAARRGSSYDRAVDNFNKWEKGAIQELRKKFLDARTEEQKQKDFEAKAEQYKEQEFRKAIGSVAGALGTMTDPGMNKSLFMKRLNRDFDRAYDLNPERTMQQMKVMDEKLAEEGYEGIKKVAGVRSNFWKKYNALLTGTEPTVNKKPAKKKSADIGGKTQKSADKTILDTFNETFEEIRQGNYTLEQFKNAFQNVLNNKEALLEALNKMKKTDLQRMVGGYYSSSDRKDFFVKRAYGSMEDFFTLHKTLSYMMGGKDAKLDAIRAIVNNMTEQDLKDFAADVKKQREQRDEIFAKYKKSLENPETLEEYQNFIKMKGKSKLTDEQLETYETLISDAKIDKAKEEKAKKAEVKQVDTDVGMDIVETKHTKKGHDLFVVTMADRVDRDVFVDLKNKAKQLGGYYSSYRGNGATPGFQFKDRDSAENFISLKEGNVDRSDFTEDKSKSAEQNAAQRLRDMATRMEEKANASLNQDRKTHTARYASQAARAEESANNDLEFAETLKNIADGVEAGDIKYLSGIRAATHIALLNKLLRHAAYENVRKEREQEGHGYSWFESNKDRAPTREDIKNIDYPHPTMHIENLLSDMLKLEDTPGLKLIAKRMIKAAKAQQRLGNHMITISNPRYIDDLRKIAAHMSSTDKYRGEWYKDRILDYDRLKKMGIEDVSMLHTALREFIEYAGKQRQADPVKAAERNLAGRKIPGFFPTPRHLSERMIEEADIKPGMSVLEPSAGKGNLADIIKETEPKVEIDVIEPVTDLRTILEAKGYNLIGHDFLGVDPNQEVRNIRKEISELKKQRSGINEKTMGTFHDGEATRAKTTTNNAKTSQINERIEHLNNELKRYAVEDLGYDRIIMNPPFEQNQDIQHVRKAYEMLKPGGRIVAIMSEHAFFGKEKEATDFREWLDEHGWSEQNPANSFMGNGEVRQTGVNTRLVIIDKDKEAYSRKDAVTGWIRIAQHDNAFQNPIHQSKDLDTILMETSGNMMYLTKTARDAFALYESAADIAGKKVNQVRTAAMLIFDEKGNYLTNRKFDIIENDNEVWINVAGMKEGAGGSMIYSAIANYAYNNGKTFIGDPSGITPKAFHRRLESMISSALKFGTTDHIAPHPYMTGKFDGESERLMDETTFNTTGFLNWEGGNYNHNLDQMLQLSYNNIYEHIPTLKDYRLDPKSFEFRSKSTGEPLTEERIEELRKSEGGSEIGAGRNTIKRALFTDFLTNEPEALSKLNDAGLDVTATQPLHEQLRQILYSRKTTEKTGATAAEVSMWLNKPIARLGNWVDVQIVQSTSDIKIKPGDNVEFPPNAMGFYYNGNVYVIADNITKKHAQDVLAHEVVGHLGIETLLGKKGFALLIKQIKQMKSDNNRTVLEIIDELQENYIDDAGKYTLDETQEAREIIAHFAEKQPKSNFLRDIYNRVRLWLSRHGFGDFDTEMLRSIVTRAARHVETDYSGFLESRGKHKPAFILGMTQPDQPLEESKPDQEIDEPAFSRKRAFTTETQEQREMEEATLEKLGMNRSARGKIMTKLNEIKARGIKEVVSRIGERTYEGLFAGLEGLKYAEEDLHVGIAAGDYAGSAYVSARMATGVADMMTHVLHYGAIEWREGVPQSVPGTRGLLDILGDLGDHADNWLMWMAGNRAEELMQQGREHNLTPQEINYLKSKSNGQFEKFNQAKQQYNELNRKMLDFAEGAGLINPKSRAGWESEWYVPFYRQDEDEIISPHTKRGMSHQTAGIKYLSGSERATGDLLENMLTNWMKLIDASVKNHALTLMVDNLQESDYLTAETLKYTKAIVPRSEIVKRIKKDREYAEMVADQLGMSKTAEEMEIVHELMGLNREGFQELWAITEPKDPRVLRIKRNGKNEYWRVNEGYDAILRATGMIGFDGFNDPFIKGARWFKRLLTTGVTAAPDFMLRNFIRDAAHAWAINKDGFKFGRDSMKGLKDALKEDSIHRMMMAGGASFQGGYVHGTDPEASAQIIRRELEKNGLTRKQIDTRLNSIVDTPAKLKSVIQQAWQHYRSFGDKVENANRIATARASLEAGKPLAQVLFESKDLMDYSMRGNFKALMYLTDMLPFLNARMQGVSKLVRAGVSDPHIVAIKMAQIAAFSIALASMNDDDERYKELQDWEKDAYWHFFLGEDHWAIPKPFEIGIIAGTIPERMYRTWLTESQPDEKLVWSLKHGLWETLGLNPIPQFMLPAWEVYANESMYFDMPIESMADKNAGSSRFRYNQYTSETMRELGDTALAEWAGLSPKQLEHLWKGYTGTIGAYALQTADIFTRNIGDHPNKPSTHLFDVPGIGAIYKGDRVKPSQDTVDFFDRLNEVEELSRSIKTLRERGDIDRARQMRDDNRDKLRNKNTLKMTQVRLRKLRKQRDDILADDTLSGDEKYRRSQEIQNKINEIARKSEEKTRSGFID